MKKALFACLFLLVTSAIHAQETKTVDISGEWTVTLSTPRGEMSFDLTITQKGTTATAVNEEGEEFEITIEGDEVSWTTELATPAGDLEMEFEGTVDGDEMTGTMTGKSGPLAGREIDWEAIREG